MSDPKTSYTDEVGCPHCGYTFKDSYEFFPDGREGSDGIEWGMCEREFNAMRHVSISYSTQKVKP